MTGSFSMPEPELISLEWLRVDLTRVVDVPRLPAVEARARFELERQAGRMWLRLRSDVLAERLPEQMFDYLVDVVVDDPRHATWFDQCLDAYRGRWWAGWLVRWRPPRYVDKPVRVRRLVRLAVGGHWTFPESRIVPSDDLGRPVLVTRTRVERWRPW